jgi:GNAT superfamily N-acetyltransferase
MSSVISSGEVIIRQAELRDAEILPRIENSAGQAFRQIPDLAWLADGEDLPVEWHRRIISQGTSWVAVDHRNVLVGFLSAEIVLQELHIWELSVLQERQRTGTGRRLLEHAIAHAKSLNLTAVTLTTFRHVPWNELFYARLGFVTLQVEETGPRLAEILRMEIARGWPGHRRCAMRLALEPRAKCSLSERLLRNFK